MNDAVMFSHVNIAALSAYWVLLIIHAWNADNNKLTQLPISGASGARLANQMIPLCTSCHVANSY